MSEFKDKLNHYLQITYFEEAVTMDDQLDIYAQRYRAYVRENTIEPNDKELFMDHYDKLSNCHAFGLWMGDNLMASIRYHIISPDTPLGPAMSAFPEIIRPILNRGETVIDPTRLVVARATTEKYPEMAYVTMRIAFMAAEHHKAAYLLATVRKEHQSFYKRLFGFKTLGEPRAYPDLLKPISIMAAHMPSQAADVKRKYPVFSSSLTERQLLFA